MYRIFDLHNDFYLKLNTDKKRIGYISKSDKFAENIVSAIWTSELNEAESFSAIDRAREFVNDNDKLFLGVEDLHFLSRDNLDKFLSFRPIYSGLTWNRSNCLAGGAHESGGLTSFGKRVVSALELNNIVLDTAHLNETSFMDVFKYSQKPVICSHTACYGLTHNERNLKDYQIKMIIDSGGIVGLCLVSNFLNGTNKSKIEDVVCQIDYFACKFGINNLALGTDFFGTDNIPTGVTNYKKLSKKLSFALEKLGYTQKSINKIFYENAKLFFKF